MQCAGLIGKSTAPSRRADALGIRLASPARASAIGNQAALRALRYAPPHLIQRKLQVGAANDPLEHEADRAADRVMRMPSAKGAVARNAEPASARVEAAPDRIEHGTAGEPLPASTRHTMERAFDHDFARVRVHRNATAGELSHRLGALAFTYGNHVYFGHGMYDPGGSSGSRLLAHELAHVVQQGQADWPSSPQAGRLAPISHGTAYVAPGTAAPMIQRATTWDKVGVVDPANNLADKVVRREAAGDTWPTLNSKIVTDGDEARDALNPPTLSLASVPAARKGAPDEFDATVATVPDNAGSFHSTVLANGPWSRNAPKASIKALFTNLTQCSSAGTSTFTAIGKPSGTEMVAGNRRHEDHHATVDGVIFGAHIGAWDKKLEAAKKAGTKYHGATKEESEAALYKAMGGTVQDVAYAFVRAVSSAGAAYHGTNVGGQVLLSNWQANPDCSTSSAECTNPS
jgi:uncharacterized protein DUF4157